MEAIPIPNMSSSTLLLLFQWCEKHIVLEGIHQRAWDRAFAGDLDTQLLLEIILVRSTCSDRAASNLRAPHNSLSPAGCELSGHTTSAGRLLPGSSRPNQGENPSGDACSLPAAGVGHNVLIRDVTTTVYRPFCMCRLT